MKTIKNIMMVMAAIAAVIVGSNAFAEGKADNENVNLRIMVENGLEPKGEAVAYQKGMGILVSIKDNQALYIDSLTCDGYPDLGNLLCNSDGLGFFPMGETMIDPLSIRWDKVIPGASYTLWVNRAGVEPHQYALPLSLYYEVVQLSYKTTSSVGEKIGISIPENLYGNPMVVCWGEPNHESAASYVFSNRGMMVDRHYEQHSSQRYWIDKEMQITDREVKHTYPEPGCHLVAILTPGKI